MTPERWQRMKDLFGAANEIDASQRTAFVEKECADDLELRAELVSLLEAHNKVNAIFDQPAAAYVTDEFAADQSARADRWVGRRIGAYKIVALLGYGGMGEVYRAQRVDAEFDKQVAIKLVPGGYQANFILTGLRTERQILANLDHPNIARLIDGGATEEGSPYLIMELVEGDPLDKYCDQHKLSLRERLKLFSDVCAAVSYAHQHLVVHRDLKPSNIMVTANGVVKLLDFGIAKLLQSNDAHGNSSEDASVTAPTQTFMRAVTPGYSSPEQILGRPITTVSDVYSLGVVLYLLLTGRSPYRGALNSTQDAIREVCETEPMRPSELVSGSNGPVPRDLDAITMRALRKEPEKRYASVEQFADDIRCYLQGLPVIARGDQFSYHAGKYFRRHKLQIAAAALIVVALLGGTIASLRQAHIAELERARAERHFASVRKLANTFMFQIHDAITDLPNSTDARRRLVTTALEYLNTLAKEATGNQSLQRELAVAYIKVGDIQGRAYETNIGDPHAAFDSYSQAIALFEPLVVAMPDDTDLRTKLAQTYSRRGQLRWTLGEMQQAADDLQHALALLESLVTVHPTTELRGELAATYTGSIEVLRRNNDSKHALINAAKAVTIMESLVRENPNDRELQFGLAGAYGNRAIVIPLYDKSTAAFDAAKDLFLKASAIDEHLVSATDGGNARYLRASFTNYNNLCYMLYIKGDYVGAVNSCRAGQPVLDKLYADTQNAEIHVDAARFRWCLGRALLAMGDLPEAATNYRDNIKSLESILKTSSAVDVQFLLAASQQGLGEIETRWATQTLKDHAAQLKHWNVAKQWFEQAVPRFQNVLAKVGVTALTDDEKASVNDATAGLAKANAALARKNLN